MTFLMMIVLSGGPWVPVDPEPAALVYGWSWAKSQVTVFDATTSPEFQIPRAADAWNVSGLRIVMTDSQLTADIVVSETTSAVCGNGAAIGCASWTLADGVPVHCDVSLASWVTIYPKTALHTAEHEQGHCFGLNHAPPKKRSIMQASIQLGDGYSIPQAYDVKDMKSLYNRR